MCYALNIAQIYILLKSNLLQLTNKEKQLNIYLKCFNEYNEHLLGLGLCVYFVGNSS